MVLAAVASGGQVQQIAKTFGVDWPHLVSQIISFAIVCFLLQRFAYKPVLQMLEKRRQAIADGIAEREAIRSELAEVDHQRQEIILRANSDAEKLIEEARQAAAHVRERETQKAIAEAEQIIIKSTEAASREHDRMLLELKQELASLVLEAATIASGKVLTPEDQARMAEETLSELRKAA
jgi:F-type H+-transporting ATPase subunit b